MSEKRLIRAADLYDLHVIGDLALAPDGQQVIYGLGWSDPDSNKKYSNLWRVWTDGRQPPAPFTFGEHADSEPRFSPDGRQIAFLSNRDEKKQQQIYLIAADGGEARPLTDLKGKFGRLVWSPAGDQILFMFRAADPKQKPDDIVVRHFTRGEYKANGGGYLNGERWHLWLVDVADGATRQLTEGDFDETDPCWSPDGGTILFVSNRHERRDFNLDETELYTIPAAGGALTQIETGHHGRKYEPAYSPDGAAIAYIGRAQPGKWPQNQSLFLVPAGGGAAQNLTAAHDFHLSGITNSDISGLKWLTPPAWTADGDAIYCQIARRGGQQIMLVDRQGGVTPIVDDGGTVNDFVVDAAGRYIVYSYATLTDTGQVLVLDREQQQTRTLTAVNKALLSELDLGTTEEVSFAGPAGYELHGWILTPPGFDPAQPYPAIIQIHGGPQTQYGRSFMHEFYYLAAQGYVVAYCNPRGSQGYGEDHAMAIFGDWGGVDVDDMLAWADYVAALPYVDGERLGVAGGSYGGYMTMSLIGRTDRFKAAVPMRLLSNFISMWATGDFNANMIHLVGFDGPPWEDLAKYWERSPISRIGQVRTPTLIIHSEQDYRCNLEQAEQVYVALQQRGVPVEMVLFPEENHELSRGGRMDRRVARLEHIARWFAAHL